MTAKIFPVNKWLLGCLALTFLFSSCKKYLEKIPDATLAIPSSIAELQALLDLPETTNNLVSPSVPETYSDDYFVTDVSYLAMGALLQESYTWQRKQPTAPNDWSKAYFIVYNANYCLERLALLSPSAAELTAWQNVKGSALFVRGYSFLNLVWEYSKVYNAADAAADKKGIVLRLKSDFNEKSVRSTVAESYEQVVKDGKEAIPLLPEFPFNPNRPSKGACYGLLARAYLSMGEYDSAFRYSDLYIKLNPYLMDFNGDPGINGSLTNNTPFKRFNREIIFYNEMQNINLPHSVSRGRIDTSLYSQFNLNDLRRTAYFRLNGGYPVFKGQYSANASIFFSGIATDEMYLVRAESNARLNRIPEAMTDLNALLVKRWRNTVPYVAVSATTRDEALLVIQKERRKELMMRGLRWIDLKRYNRDGQAITITRKINGQLVSLAPGAAYYAIPIPEDIIQITGMEQN